MSTITQPVDFTTEEINLLFDALDKHTITPKLSDYEIDPGRGFGHRSFFEGIFNDMARTTERVEKNQRENREKIRSLQTKLIQYKNDLTSKSVEDIEATPADEASNA